jgi:hypothetical protein
MLVEATLAATPRSPTAFQRRHLTGIPDYLEGDERHQQLLAHIAADAAFVAQKQRLESMLVRRAQFTPQTNSCTHHNQKKKNLADKGDSLPRDVATTPTARRAAASATQGVGGLGAAWEAIAKRRCVNSQSRYILMAATMREKGMREKLECECTTMLDDPVYLKKQLDSVDFMGNTE